MCGSFSCSKSTLIALNIVYVMIAFLLIGVASYGKGLNMITSVPTVGGIIASGIFLLVIAVAGIFGAMKHHQVMLFVYMVVLFGIFVIQFSVSCACLAVSKEDELKIAEKAWYHVADNETKFAAEKFFGCCGYKNRNVTGNDGVKCDLVEKCKPEGGVYNCPTCEDIIQDKIGYAFSASGGVGLFFSFTEVVGAFIAWRYRNMLDPRSPSLAGTGLYGDGNM